MEVKVNVNSVDENHNSPAPTAPPQPKPAAPAPTVPVGNSEFISLAQAAKLTGYHQDYLGQLARGGKLMAQKIGRNWVTTLDAVKKLSPQAAIPEIAAETKAEPKTVAAGEQTIFEKPSVSLAEHEALKKELDELRKQILERAENEVHDKVYVRPSSFEDEARKDLLPATPISVPPSESQQVVAKQTLKPQTEEHKSTSPLSKMKMAVAAVMVIAISWAVVSVIFYAYEGYAPKPVKDVAELLNFNRASQISGSSISR